MELFPFFQEFPILSSPKCLFFSPVANRSYFPSFGNFPFFPFPNMFVFLIAHNFLDFQRTSMIFTEYRVLYPMRTCTKFQKKSVGWFKRYRCAHILADTRTHTHTDFSSVIEFSCSFRTGRTKKDGRAELVFFQF